MFFSREKLAFLGGILIIASGLVSIWIGVNAGLMFYEPDPGGVFGHVERTWMSIDVDERIGTSASAYQVDANNQKSQGQAAELL